NPTFVQTHEITWQLKLMLSVADWLQTIFAATRGVLPRRPDHRFERASRRAGVPDGHPLLQPQFAL
ncbi:MAG: hypothetical protein AAB654_23230, partial [Acidobacteriota bacterium]